MPEFIVRKIIITVEEIYHENGPIAEQPRKRGAVIALVNNPFAGKYHPELQSAMDDLKPLALEMSAKLIDALGGRDGIDGYGKAGLCGEAGELEHSSLWHVAGGYAMREYLGEAKAIVPSSMKVGGVGRPIDIPLGHINAAYVRSHFDAMEVSVPDGPRANELLLALGMTCGPRIHSRMGGLEVADIEGIDGLR